jgi:hypothetical protein
MTDFKPTTAQQALIEAAQRRFEQSREATKGYSKRFLDKCNDQNPQTPGAMREPSAAAIDCPAENASPVSKK